MEPHPILSGRRDAPQQRATAEPEYVHILSIVVPELKIRVTFSGMYFVECADHAALNITPSSAPGWR
jgi:hypothetical protein